MTDNNPKRVILHCSATPDYPKDNAAFDAFGALDIDEWHRARGWREIGYHYVIRRSGMMEAGSRHWTEYGAHASGENKDSLGVCYIGTRWPTLNQVDSLLALFGTIYMNWGIHPQQWYPHYEFNSQKTCPGISIHVIRRLLELELENLMRGEIREANIITVRR